MSQVPAASTVPARQAASKRPTGGGFVRTFRWVAVAALLGYAAFVVWRRLTYIPEVRVTLATREELYTSFTAEGVIRGTDYSLGPEIGGRVVDLRVREGDDVRQGEILFQLDTEQPAYAVAEMRASLAAAMAKVDQATREQKLIIDEHEAAISAAKARIAQAELEHRRLMAGARPEEKQQATQRVLRAEAALEEAEKAYRRAETLHTAGALARASLEKAEAAYKAATAETLAARAAEQLVRAGPSPEEIALSRAAIQVANSELVRVESAAGQVEVAKRAVRSAQALVAQVQASLQRTQSALESQTVRSPSDGVVTRLNIELGSVVMPGTPAIVVSTRKDLRGEAEISTEDTSKVGPGAEVQVTSAAYPGRVFRARVIGLMPVGELKPDAAIRTRIVRARIRLEEGLNLFRPGMEVDIEGRRLLGRLLTVPTDAVRFTGTTATVLTVETGTVRERKVAIGSQNPERTEILSGVAEGERVILRGKDELKAGERVKVVP